MGCFLSLKITAKDSRTRKRLQKSHEIMCTSIRACDLDLSHQRDEYSTGGEPYMHYYYLKKNRYSYALFTMVLKLLAS